MSRDLRLESDENQSSRGAERKDAPVEDGWDEARDRAAAAMEKWESSEDRMMAESIAINRRQQEILRGQGEHAAADAMEESLQKLPVSDEIKADPQGYLDRLQERDEDSTSPSDGAATSDGWDDLDDAATTPMEKWERSEDRMMAESIAINRRQQEILRGQGEHAAADAMEESLQKLPVSDETKADPDGYLEWLRERDEAAERDRRKSDPSDDSDGWDDDETD